jgi:CRP-like cAMP-binding protein
VSGAFLPVLAILAWRRLAAIDAAFQPPVEQLAVLRGSAIFSPLPPAEQEHLAHELVPVSVPAGDVVVREGDVGDRFYLVRSGELEVTVEGKPVRTLTQGDHFGEIALLRDVPRTATVTAASDVELYSLERDEFIGSVTGHAPSAEAADAVVMQRLATARTGLATE